VPGVRGRVMSGARLQAPRVPWVPRSGVELCQVPGVRVRVMSGAPGALSSG
jgi:hypothetical protein